MQKGDNTLHRGIGNQPAIPHQSANASIATPILAIIANAHHIAVGQLQPARPLNLQEEKFDNIGCISDFKAAPSQGPVFNHRPVIILQKFRAADLATDAASLQLIRKLPKVNIDQV